MRVDFGVSGGVLTAGLTPDPDDVAPGPAVGPRLASRSARFSVPAGWELDGIHPDLLGLVALHLAHTWTRSSLELSHAVSPEFAATVGAALRREIGPVDASLSPRRRPVDGVPALAFSGGADSTAAVAVMPEETALVFLERLPPPGGGGRSIYDKSAALRACEVLTGRGRSVHRLGTDLEHLRDPVGFPTDLANAVPALLLADRLRFDAVGWGTIAESAYRIGSKHWVDYGTRGPTTSWSALYAAVGLPILNAVAGVSEVGTSSIVLAGGLDDVAQSCIRGGPGSPCMNCWKCFRKTLLDAALTGRWPDDRALDHLFAVREAGRFLSALPIKHENVLTFALSGEVPDHPLLQLLRRRVRGDVLRPTWLRRTYQPALDLLPEDYRETVRARLRTHLEPMSPADEQSFRSWDMRPVIDDERYQALSRELTDALAAHTPPRPVQAVRSALGGRVESPTRTRRPDAGRRQRILFMSSNGAGMGHLTRLLALARRTSPGAEPLFFSLSQAVGVIGQEGYPYEFFPSRDYLRIPARRWNRMLHDRLSDVLRWHRPDAVVFDGVYPYLGLLLAKDSHPGVPFVWSRRGMWKEGTATEGLQRSSDFARVVEPGDLAAAYDRGPTRGLPDAVRVGPVTYLDASDLLDRAEAAALLGIDARRPAALVTLGAGNINDTSSALRTALRALEQVEDVQVCVTHAAIAGAVPEAADATVVSYYPLSRCLRAFDLAVSASGYNSFHELVTFGVPTIWLPNLSTATDDQLARARFADDQGIGVCVADVDDGTMLDAVRRVVEHAEEMARGCAALAQPNGARDAVRSVEELVERAHRTSA